MKAQGLMKKRIFLSPPYVGAPERKAVMEAFDTGYIAPCGPMVDLFEKRLAEISSRKFAVAVSSTTAAIDLMMEEANVMGLAQYGGLHYEHLHGDKEGLSSVKVNDQYRIEFREILQEDQTIAEIVSITDLSNHYK